MNLEIRKSSMEYTVPLQLVTQICGINFEMKEYLRKSIGYHFSSHKYMDYEQDMIGNIRMNGEEVGRKYLECTMIESREDLIKQVALSKTSLGMQVLQEVLKSFDQQQIQSQVQRLIEKMYVSLNQELQLSNGIQFVFEDSKLGDMMQSSMLTDAEGRSLAEMDNEKLLQILLDFLFQTESRDGGKRIIWINDIDHLLPYDKYCALIKNIMQRGRQYPIYFIFTMSIEGYVYLKKETVNGIVVVNDLNFDLGDYEHIHAYILDHYPCMCEIDDESLYVYLQESVQRLANRHHVSLRGEIIRRILNASVFLESEKTKEECDKINQLELEFLKAT